VGDLKWARASYASVRGEIAARWQHDAGKFTLSVTIPANTTATVFLPANSAKSVTEGGQPVAQARGVKFLREEKGHAVFEIESGAYEFASAWE
jgi:alpha-L-rhamnosidase